jgi:hypothetical protein
MAKTFQPTRRVGAAQSLPAAASHSGGLLTAYRAVDCPNATPLGQTVGGLDWGPSDPPRTAQSVRQTDSVVAHHQAGVANARLGVHAHRGVSRLFPETTDDGRGNTACDGLDVWLYRRRSQGLCVSHAQLAHARLFSNHCRRQKQRHGDPALLEHLENAWNPAVFATRQRRCFLWRLQSSARLRAIRPAVFVFGPRAHLFAHRRTQMQWRGRRVERPVGTCLLGTTTVYFFRASVLSQSSVCALVYDGLCAARVSRRDAQAGATQRSQTSSHRDSDCALAGSVAADRRTDSFHSQGQVRWHSCDPQRTWKVSKRLAGKYAWVTVITHCRQLDI